MLRHVSAAARRAHLKLFVLVWHGFAARDAPTPAERADFAAFAAATVKALPYVRHVVVGNEPNLDTFWKPQFGATGLDLAASGYADLLARSYDAIKEVDPNVLVIGGSLSPRGADRPHGSRPTHSPTSFIRDLGAAYRASGRQKPLMDAFALHPYMEASRYSPTNSHPKNTSITIADYPKLVALLNEAFRGTDQRGATLPIYYTEFGVQTRVPAPKLGFYADSDSPERGGQRRLPAPGRLLPRGAPARVLPADRAGPLPLPHLRRGRLRRLAVGALLRRRDAEAEPAGVRTRSCKRTVADPAA